MLRSLRKSVGEMPVLPRIHPYADGPCSDAGASLTTDTNDWRMLTL